MNDNNADQEETSHPKKLHDIRINAERMENFKFATFTPREIELLQLIADGHSKYQDLADHMTPTERTKGEKVSLEMVKFLLRSITNKLEIAGQGHVDTTRIIPELLILRLAEIVKFDRD